MKKIEKDEIIPSYLIQRGKVNKFGDEYNTYAVFDFVNLDYMGSSEFEWGALPKSLNHIYQNKDKFILKESDIQSADGRKLFLFCHKDNYDYVENTFKHHIENNVRTKEYTDIKRAFKPLNEKDKSEVNFWWDIEYCFMGILGDQEMAENFNKAFENSYQRKQEFLKLKSKPAQEEFSDKVAKESRENRARLNSKISTYQQNL